MPRRPHILLLLICFVAVLTPAPAHAEPIIPVARDAEPVVLTGLNLPLWSQLPALAAPAVWPMGARDPEFGQTNPFEGERTAHAGTVIAPPDPIRVGAVPEEIAAYRWQNGWVEIPVQVDERFPNLLANPPSDFSFYSATDEELTYEWDVENWKKTAGECFSEYPEGEGVTEDPVAGFDDDDELAFMASDAGEQAPEGAKGPVGTIKSDPIPSDENFPPQDATRQEVTVVDPLDPTTLKYVYLFIKPQGSAFNATNGYVSYDRDDNADQWIDRSFFADDDPEKLGTSNTGYGPNLSGTVCDEDLVSRLSPDRFPRDGVTVSTRSYQWRATGRWMVREMHVAKPGQPYQYGPDLIDRWKGRAFQQSPDSSISLVGFEDEQVNWEANSALLGERLGPVRAIRETWGSDSGTNTTKTETFYRDAITYRYHLRVHPIPPDGIYQAWDYNAGVATKYFNFLKPDGVDIDGVNDDVGNIDGFPFPPPDGNFPAFFDAPDPTFNVLTATEFWEQVSGAEDFGSLVYIIENKGPTSAENPLAFPLYRDDACFDDGTGDDPVLRPYPGEPTTDQRVKDGYVAAAGGTPYEQLTCDQKQGAWGQHGLHVFFTGDTDNAMQSKPLTESDAQQWQFAVPTGAPAAVGEPYAEVVRVPLKAVALPQANEPMHGTSLAITGATTGQATDPVTLAANLLLDGQPFAGATIDFSFQGVTRNVTTDADGNASLPVAKVNGPAGETPLQVSYAGNGDDILPSSASTQFAVTREDTTVVLDGATSGQLTDTTTLAARVTEDGGPLAGVPLRFKLGEEVLTATTDGNGRAQVQHTLTGVDGTRTVRAEFDQDPTFNASVANGSFNVEKEDTSLTLTAPASGRPGDVVTLSARLADEAGVADKQIRFKFQGADTLATTNASGIASVQRTVQGPDGSAPIVAEFDGDATYLSSTATKSFNVAREATKISFTAVKGKKKTVDITARLVRLDSSALAGKTIRFLVDGTEVGTATTDVNGFALKTITYPKPKGHMFRVAFDGDAALKPVAAQGVFGKKDAAGSATSS